MLSTPGDRPNRCTRPRAPIRPADPAVDRRPGVAEDLPFDDVASVGGDVRIERRPGVARFASIDDRVHTDLRGWTLADGIDDDQYEELRRAAGAALARFTRADGAVRFDAPALIAVVVR